MFLLQYIGIYVNLFLRVVYIYIYIYIYILRHLAKHVITFYALFETHLRLTFQPLLNHSYVFCLLVTPQRAQGCHSTKVNITK